MTGTTGPVGGDGGRTATKRAAATTNGHATATSEPPSARRLLPALDFTGPADTVSPNVLLDAAALHNAVQLSASHFYEGLIDLRKHIDFVKISLPTQLLPPHIVGTLVQPSGTAAARVQVEAELPSTDISATPPRALTNDDGSFEILLPRGAAIANQLTLTVRGSDGSAQLNLQPADIGATGLVGTVQLPNALSPLPVSIVESLRALIGAQTALIAPGAATASGAAVPVVKLGEADGVCGMIFGANAAVERFPYSVLFRLVEPRASILNKAFRIPWLGGRFIDISARNAAMLAPLAGNVQYVERVPVDQPISVDGFRDQIIGAGNASFIDGNETVPMAGTLGLGYIVQMAQHWEPLGLTLGDLVYSLPLAPGEQQRVAIFERQDVTSVREAETLDVVEQQAFQQSNDTSAAATFSQAFNESASGGSHFDTQASSASAGVNLLVFSGGGGSASSSGNNSNWMEGQRNVVSNAAEQTHGAVERTAAARRSAQRTSMRLASASESGDVTTKVITNHNHTRALTLQYWEVVRLFEVSSAVQGVSLVCMVPLEVIRFLPAGQPVALPAPDAPQWMKPITKRPDVLSRYAEIAKNADVLAQALPRSYRYGLELLNEFVADPRATVDVSTTTAEDVIRFSLDGTFLPFEEIYVSGVTKRGTRVGPVRLTGPVDEVGLSINLGFATIDVSFSDEDSLFGNLRSRRQNSDYTLTGAMALPPSLARTDIVGFEITRRFQSFDKTFVTKEVQSAFAAGTGLFAGLLDTLKVEQIVSHTVHYTPDKLESEIGGPFVWNFSAIIEGASDPAPPDPQHPNASETYATGYISQSQRFELPPGALPIPARELPPILRFSALLQIEKTLQHVVRNAIAYSKAVWSSLTPEERAIMLEGFTIGVPTGGIQDDTQHIPLLNCITNQVLGYAGNAMVMPFLIPLEVAEQNADGVVVGNNGAANGARQPLTTGEIQDALTNFHRVGFDPPKSRVGLPTRGVLGEAVLGHCPSAERIDLTRFWNWADSPADSAPVIADVTVPTTQPSQAAGLQGPNALTGMAPLITNFNNSPPVPVDTSLVSGLITAGAGQKDFTGLINADALAGLVKQTQTTAESARADALKRATELQSQAMTEIGNFFGATGGEAYASNYGSGGSSASTGDTSGSGKGSGKGGKGGGGKGGGGGGGDGGGGNGGGGGANAGGNAGGGDAGGGDAGGGGGA